MKWSELRRLAEQNGWVLIRFGKKHNAYQKGSKRVFFERHTSQEIRNRLYHKLLKQLDLKHENDSTD